MTNDIDIAPIGLLTGKVVFITGAGRGIGGHRHDPIRRSC